MFAMIPKIRHPEPHEGNVVLDHVLTSIMYFFLLVVLVMGRHNPSTIAEFGGYTLATVFAIPCCKALFTLIGARIGVAANLEKPRNLRKFADQSWQLVIHVGMTAVELWLLARPAVAWFWWNEPGAPLSTWDPRDQAEIDPALRSFYLCQLGIWFYTAFSCRYVEARHKDYFVMYDVAARSRLTYQCFLSTPSSTYSRLTHSSTRYRCSHYFSTTHL
jgi:hypothetical protein